MDTQLHSLLVKLDSAICWREKVCTVEDMLEAVKKVDEIKAQIMMYGKPSAQL